MKRVVRVVIAVGVAMAAPFSTGSVAAHSGGDDYTYVKSQPNLCRNIKDTVHVHTTPYRIKVAKVHGTYDFTDTADGYSLRTCDWKAKSGYVDYRCRAPQDKKSWTIALTRRSEKGGSAIARAKGVMTCNGKWQRVNYSWSARDSTHLHLWGAETSTLRDVEIYVPPA